MEELEKRIIKLSRGNTLEVTIHPGFLERVASHFMLNSISEVDDDHVRMYIFGAFKNAVDKIENEPSQ